MVGVGARLTTFLILGILGLLWLVSGCYLLVGTGWVPSHVRVLVLLVVVSFTDI